MKHQSIASARHKSNVALWWSLLRNRRLSSSSSLRARPNLPRPSSSAYKSFEAMQKRYRREILDQLQMNSLRGETNEDTNVAFFKKWPAKVNASDFDRMRSIKSLLWKIRHDMLHYSRLHSKASNTFVYRLHNRLPPPNRPILGSNYARGPVCRLRSWKWVIMAKWPNDSVVMQLDTPIKIQRRFP